MNSRLTIENIQNKKKNEEKITMLTAYDYPMAELLDRGGIDIVLVGDSLANVVQGLDSTRDVSLTEMLYHCQLVSRAVKHALVIGDMPFIAYQPDPSNALIHAKRFIEEASCDAVKIEWFEQCPDVVSDLVSSGLSVMGHVGLTPQTVENLGGFIVQGKDFSSAKKIIEQAKILEQQGCFAIVLECIPDQLAKLITEKISIPTIGIGAGPYCDGQVLVTNDLLGLSQRRSPKFVKRYIDLSTIMSGAIQVFRDEVNNGLFPDDEHSYHMKAEELTKIQEISS